MAETDSVSSGILLEAGTNELEVLEFYLANQSFGINVQKLREIVPYEPDEITHLPESHPSMLGTVMLRGKSVPVMDLKTHLGKQGETEARKEMGMVRQVILVCEFNQQVYAFLVDGVNQIHRVRWDQVKPMDAFFSNYSPRFTGSIHIDERDVLIVDMELVACEVFSDDKGGCQFDNVAGLETDAPDQRQDVRLFIAEDSAIIRQGIHNVMQKAGFGSVESFVDGKRCWDRLQQVQSAAELPHLIISDIEMPEMDGLTLCRKIKENTELKQIKVLIYSSLINDASAHKCTEVGADGFMSKPDMSKLVEKVDEQSMGA